MRREATEVGSGVHPREYELRETRKRFEQLVGRAEVMLGGTGFGIRVDKTARTFAFDHATREIIVSPSLIERKGLTPKEQEYVFFHEIGHFVQLADDPDTYVGLFDKAQVEGRKFEDDIAPFVETAWNHFYNSLLDMDTNAKVEARNPSLRGERQKCDVREDLYKKLVSGSLKSCPMTEQFNFAVLHAVMLPDEMRLEVDEEVKVRLETQYQYLGRTYTSFYAFAKEKFFDGDLSFGELCGRIDRASAPLFREFVAMDVSSGDIKKVQRSTDITGEGIDADEARKTASGMKRAREGASQRAGRASADRLASNMRDGGFSKLEIARMQEIRNRTQVAFTQMIDLWNLLFTATPLFERDVQSGYRSGQEFDVDAFVQQIDRYITDPDQLRVYSRDILEPAGETLEPRLIYLHLILDASGSMDAEKKKATQEAVYALCMSLLQFYRNKKISDGDTSGVEIRFSIDGFGDKTETFLRIDQATWANDLEDPRRIETLLFRAILAYFNKDLGGTQDDAALNAAVNDLNEQEVRRRLENGDAVALVVEVTDGETSTANESANSKRALDDLPNVSSYGLRIPGGLQSDNQATPNMDGDVQAPEIVQPTGAFKTVWGKDGYELPSIQHLPGTMLGLLRKLVEARNKQKEI